VSSNPELGRYLRVTFRFDGSICSAQIATAFHGPVA
jgi:hypothetical protein